MPARFAARRRRRAGPGAALGCILSASTRAGLAEEVRRCGARPFRADVTRLFLFFDVALENNLASLVCQYITRVCVDERAASSDPALAFLLDEVVVKDWCAWSYKSIVEELRHVYLQVLGKVNAKICLPLKYLSYLSGIASILETMETSLKNIPDAQLDEMHMLFENVLRVKQHAEITNWCIKHEFLENIPSHYKDFTSWCSIFEEKKSAAVSRCWPNVAGASREKTLDCDSHSTLFIEDALANLEPGNEDKVEELSLTCQLKGRGCTVHFDSKIRETERYCYPFENFRTAADILFLHGSPNLVDAKRAIFLYYLFDRQWTVSDVHWKHLLDDFGATFGITRHSLMESYTFYLLDDHSEEAIKEASRILPDIANRKTHPKVAQVLLERHQPDLALAVLRCCGHVDLPDFFASSCSPKVSIADAVIGVRVRVECGLLTEAFMYQRAYCQLVKEQTDQTLHSTTSFEESKCEKWMQHMSILVIEICLLCARRNLVERLIQCPWNSDEEKHLHKCFYEWAIEDPSTTASSFLVMFYLQRYRYTEAYEIHQKLLRLETKFISNSKSEETTSRMRETIHWRETLLDKSFELLPEVQQRYLKSQLFPNPEKIIYQKSNGQMFTESSRERQTDFSSPIEQCADTLQAGYETTAEKSTGGVLSPKKAGLETNGSSSVRKEKSFPRSAEPSTSDVLKHSSLDHNMGTSQKRSKQSNGHPTNARIPNGSRGFNAEVTMTRGEKALGPTREGHVRTLPLVVDGNEAPAVLQLRLMVDEEKMRVVYAECNRFTVDVILSFLTTPVAALIRSTSKGSCLGHMDSLYQSVKQMDADYFETPACQDLLLLPRSASGFAYHRLKIQLNDADKENTVACPSMKCSKYSLFKDVKCECGMIMTNSMPLGYPPPAGSDVVFLNKDMANTFLVTDDLFICPTSHGLKLQICASAGVDHNELKELIVFLSKEKILELLKESLLSNTPLTKIFLESMGEPIHWSLDVLRQHFIVTEREKSHGIITRMLKGMVASIFGGGKMIITIYQDQKTVMLTKDFVNLLFSFLTFPLGSIVAAFGGCSHLGCLDNVHKIAKRFFSDGYFHGDYLLNPPVAHHHDFANQLLKVGGMPMQTFYVNCQRCFTRGANPSCTESQHIHHFEWKPINPKFRGKHTTRKGGGYMRWLGNFLISNELNVKPLYDLQDSSFERGLDEKCVVVDHDKAFDLLRACLISQNPLDIFFTAIMEP